MRTTSTSLFHETSVTLTICRRTMKNFQVTGACLQFRKQWTKSQMIGWCSPAKSGSEPRTQSMRTTKLISSLQKCFCQAKT